MNRQQLEQLMAQIHGNSIVSIDTETNVKLAGGVSNPFQGLVTKRVTGSNVIVFQNKNINGYEAMVKRRLEAEGKNPSDFVLSPRQWGQRIPNTPFVEHKGQLYLEVIFLRAGESEILVGGKPYNQPIPGFPVKAEEGDQGGLTNKVIIRTYKVDSIKAITINKQRYV